jgi:uncharacterized protein (DUF2236 family)
MRQRHFFPDSPFWRVNREWLSGLAVARAALLELAHPLVAAGVADYSGFRQDPFGRLYRTMRVMTALTFGDAETACKAIQHFNRCHDRVRGALRESVGPFAPGTPYRANDPELKFWVLATLIDSVLLVYELFVAPLSCHDKRAYYRDSQVLARLLGIPPEMMPLTYDEFMAYMEAMLTGERLSVGETARKVVEALLTSPLFGAFARLIGFVGIGLLPARLRDAYQLSWTQKQERRLYRLASISRRIRPWLPDVVCVNTTSVIAEWQIRLEKVRDQIRTRVFSGLPIRKFRLHG